MSVRDVEVFVEVVKVPVVPVLVSLVTLVLLDVHDVLLVLERVVEVVVGNTFSCTQL
jgi:hypothetical protein